MSIVASERSYNAERFKELVLYISYRNRENPRFGSTLLNKMLYYADFSWYAKTGVSLTADVYVRREYGPTPKHLIEIRQELEAAGLLQMIHGDYFGKEQRRPYVAIEPTISSLKESEIHFVDAIIDQLASLNATQVSELTHKELSWKLLHNDEVVPYESVFLRNVNPIPIDTMEWSKKIIDERKEPS